MPDMAAAAIRHAACTCGKVRCEAVGTPIVSAVCYCDGCQEGGRRIEALPNAPPVLDADGGTPFLTYRDDRFRVVAGSEFLVGYRIRDDSPTQRMVASCCNAAMYLKFGPGFWRSTYQNRYEKRDLPPIEMRMQIAFRNSSLPVPDDAPRFRGTPLRLFARGLKARIAMLLGR
jgi:hypothetical protein